MSPDTDEDILPREFRRAERFVNGMTATMAVVSGGLYMLVAIYMTVDVTSRRFGGPFTGVTDEISGYALAMGMTWAMAYALTVGNHVRVDVLLPRFPARLREALEIAAVVLLGVFAGTLTVFTWQLAADSYAIDAKAVAMIETPLVLPQSLMAVGFTTLTVQAAFNAVTGAARLIAAIQRNRPRSVAGRRGP